MAAETQTQQAGAANKTKKEAEARSPVLWGRKERLERISLTVMNGRLWFHVFTGKKHRASVGIPPREIVKLGAIGEQALQLAEQQNEEFEARMSEARMVEFNQGA